VVSFDLYMPKSALVQEANAAQHADLLLTLN
jgi:hypothetical protein